MDEKTVGLYTDFDNRFQQSQARFGIERAALTEVPVIDFSPFAAGDSAAARRDIGRQIRRACIDIGFFYLVGHGIPAADLAEAIRRAHELFGLPLAEKMKLHKNLSPSRQGYMQVGGTDPDANDDTAADLREVFGMSREVMAGEPAEGRFGAGEAQWPADDVLSGFQDFMQRHIAQQVALAQQLAQGFAISLDLPETYFDDIHRFLGCNYSLNNYRAFGEDELQDNQWGISPHSDYGSFTMLAQDDLGGLQVRNAAGAWIDVPPIPGSFVVNIGDLFAIWTNDLFTPNLHRATAVREKPRISTPFFVFPQGVAEVRCLETCQGPDNAPRYSPTTAGEHVWALIQRSHETGRPGIAARTAERFRAQ